MRCLWSSRRTFISTLGLLSLTYLGTVKDHDVSLAIAGIVSALVAGNAYQKRSNETSEVSGG